MKVLFRILFLEFVLSFGAFAGQVPGEFESLGGHSLGFSNGGMAAISGHSSIRANPAMLAFEPQYSFSLGYQWPTYGRDFYQAGVVDSKTAPVAAGFMFTSSTMKYEGIQSADSNQDRQKKLLDSPIKHRMVLGLAYPFSKLALGFGGEYVRGYTFEGSTIEGTALNIGLAGLIMPELRFGISAENLANKRIQGLAPNVYRAALALTLFGGNITTHLDYSQREKVPQEFLEKDLTGVTDKQYFSLLENTQIEKMVVASFSARLQNLLRVMGAYGRSVDGPVRQSVSAGIALVNNNFTCSYNISRPYLSQNVNQHSINLSVNVSL